MTIARIPSAGTPSAQPAAMHWLVTPSNEPHTRTACRAALIDSNGSARQDMVTCQRCLDAVIRVHCNAVADEPGPLPARCSRPPHKCGSHDWVPNSQAMRHAEFAREDLIVRNPQSAEVYAAEALRRVEVRPEVEEPAEVTPSGRLWPRVGRWTA